MCKCRKEQSKVLPKTLTKKPLNSVSTDHGARVLLKHDAVGFTPNCKSCFRASYSQSFLPHGSLPERVEPGGAGERVERNENEPQNSFFKRFFLSAKGSRSVERQVELRRRQELKHRSFPTLRDGTTKRTLCTLRGSLLNHL